MPARKNKGGQSWEENVDYGVAEPPRRVLAVRWIDASSQVGPIGRADLSGEHEIHTVGWLVRQTVAAITLCQDYVPTSDEFREVIHIPRVYVREVKELSELP